MLCECCKEEAESVLETLESGVSRLCEECADAAFIARLQSRMDFTFQGWCGDELLVT
jgi:hypothetical protein